MSLMGHLRRGTTMAASGGVDVANLVIQGSCTFQDYGVVEMHDGDYRLLAITSSGNLVPAEPVNIEVCVVGGGSNGQLIVNEFNRPSLGGAGAYMKNQVIEAFDGGTVVVGAAKGASSIGDVNVSAVSGQNGGTGGGGHGHFYKQGGTGDGLSKYPFGDHNYELWSGKPHCAGGGGGGFYNPNDGNYKGGNGGTNGSSGSNATGGSVIDDDSPGIGGSYGGGKGGDARYDSGANGGNATYYGSGGGGQGYGNGYYSSGTDGSGYQGIVYVRIPIDQIV